MADERHQVFLSYSHNDLAAAAVLHEALKRPGLAVFWDKTSLREGDLWLDRLQQAVDGCGAFVLLVGRHGVGRWVGAEAQAALNRYFGPRDDSDRLPIFPILLDDSRPETLPAFLRLFQATPWDGAEPLPQSLLERIRDRKLPDMVTVRFEGPPFVGLAGILSRSADGLLDSLGPQRERALKLLFRLVKVDSEGSRHARQRIPLTEAIAVTGGGEAGRAVVDRLAGHRARDGGRNEGPLRLITIGEETGKGKPPSRSATSSSRGSSACSSPTAMLRQPEGQGHPSGRRPAAKLRARAPLRAAGGYRPAPRVG